MTCFTDCLKMKRKHFLAVQAFYSGGMSPCSGEFIDMSFEYQHHVRM